MVLVEGRLPRPSGFANFAPIEVCQPPASNQPRPADGCRRELLARIFRASRRQATDGGVILRNRRRGIGGRLAGGLTFSAIAVGRGGRRLIKTRGGGHGLPAGFCRRGGAFRSARPSAGLWVRAAARGVQGGRTSRPHALAGDGDHGGRRASVSPAVTDGTIVPGRLGCT